MLDGTLIADFFAPPNLVGRDDADAAPWVQMVTDGASAFLLPRRDASGSWTWYAVGTEDTTARSLKEDVEAFVGPTYGRIEEQAATLDPDDPPEAALRSVEAARIFRLHAAEAKAAAAINRQLSLMRVAWSNRPPTVGATQRTTSQILRELDSAMSSSHLHLARDLIDELHAGGRLSSVNLECLEIWWLATQERWTDVLIRPGLDDLIALRLPRNATAALIDAVYHVQIEPYEGTLSPGELALAFAERVLPRFGRLFRNPAWSNTAAGRKAWMLFAASTQPPSEAIREAVLSDAPEEERDDLLAFAVAQPTPIAPVEDIAAAVSTMLETGDFSGAWQAVRAQDDGDTAWRARVLLHCAYETGDPEWAAHALMELDQARQFEPSRLTGRTIAEQERELRQLITPSQAPISGWREWLATLAVSSSPRDLVSLARDRSEGWQVAGMLEAPDASDLALDVLTAGRATTEAFREVRPLLLPAVLEATTERPDLTVPASRLLRIVADGLVGDERIGYADLDDLAAIAEFLFMAGLTADEYRAVLLDSLQRAWERTAGTPTIGWLIDAVELVATSPCLDEGARSAFVTELSTALARFRNLVPPEHWDRAEEVYEIVGRRAEIQGLRPQVEEADAALAEWHYLAGRRVFVYTLVEQVGERARKYLADVAPTAVVDVWGAAVADDRMLQAVRAASLVVIATRAAKHAATLALEREVPDDVPVVYPTGKGWSSIVAAVRDALPQLGHTQG